MARTIKFISLLMVIGIGFYIYSLLSQVRGAADLCDSYPVGSQIENLEKLESVYGLTLMGPIEVKDKPGVQEAIFCAALTMCDTFCSLEIQNGRVTQSNYSNL